MHIVPFFLQILAVAVVLAYFPLFVLLVIGQRHYNSDRNTIGRMTDVCNGIERKFNWQRPLLYVFVAGAWLLANHVAGR